MAKHPHTIVKDAVRAACRTARERILPSEGGSFPTSIGEARLGDRTVRAFWVVNRHCPNASKINYEIRSLEGRVELTNTSAVSLADVAARKFAPADVGAAE